VGRQVESRFWRPSPLALQVFCPPGAARNEVLPLGDQPLVQLTREQRDAVHPGVVAKEVAGEADLAAAGGYQHLLIEIGPFFNQLVARPRSAGEVDAGHTQSNGTCVPS
jgi:hypothetical protein